MRVIEFTGLPGAGKTTLCTQLVNNLKPAYTIVSYHDVYEHFWIKRKLVRLCSMNHDLHTFYGKLQMVVGEYANVSLGAVDKLLVLFWYCARHNNDKDTTILLEEGFVQNITSIMHLQKIKNYDRVKELTDYISAKFNVIVVDCNINVEQAVERLRHRNSRDRFNTIEHDKELISALLRKRDNINVIAHAFTSYKIDMNDSLQVNCDYLSESLFEEQFKTN